MRQDGSLLVAVVQTFAPNTSGRDFVVGDIHGMFPVLEAVLDEIGFDVYRDRLFSVGDIVDRGPASADALTWWTYPWFHACRGNHEQMLLDSHRDPANRSLWAMNGGTWWADIPPARREAFVETCHELPYAMEIETARGAVGIVHADLPRGCTWDDLLEALGRRDRKVMAEALWSRTHIHDDAPVPDAGERIWHVYCGHTVIRAPKTRGKITWIDTGACYADRFSPAHLTLLEFHPGSSADV